MSRFEGRTVVVTGASRGLGQAIAEAFGREGAFVYVCFRDREDAAQQTLRLLPEGRAALLRFDVTRPDEVERAFACVHEERQRVDVLVNNAGSAQDAPFALLDAASWSEVLSVNLDGAFHCARAVVARMMYAKQGAIVNVASSSGLRANPGQASYAASKGGLLALSRTLAAELAPKNIRVNAVIPGFIDAGLTQHLDHRMLERGRARIPLGRLGRAEEVAKAVTFLASDDAAYVVGAELTVDGGLTL